VKFVPTGGVGPKTMGDYLSIPAVAAEGAPGWFPGTVSWFRTSPESWSSRPRPCPWQRPSDRTPPQTHGASTTTIGALIIRPASVRCGSGPRRRSGHRRATEGTTCLADCDMPLACAPPLRPRWPTTRPVATLRTASSRVAWTRSSSLGSTMTASARGAANRHGTVVPYDLNYRPSLWKSIGGPDKAQLVNPGDCQEYRRADRQRGGL